MKLTAAQKKALVAIGAGNCPYTWKDTFWPKQNAAPLKVLFCLINKRLVAEMERGEGVLTLTDAGRAALEELRRGQE